METGIIQFTRSAGKANSFSYYLTTPKNKQVRLCSRLVFPFGLKKISIRVQDKTPVNLLPCQSESSPGTQAKRIEYFVQELLERIAALMGFESKYSGEICSE